MKQVSKHKIKEFFSLLKKSKTVLITGHTNPDADVIGSALALYLGITKTFQDKKVKIFFRELPQDNLKFLPCYDQVLVVDKVSEKFDLGIILECSDLSRTGNIIDVSLLKYLTIIDHHLNNHRKKISRKVGCEILDITYPEYSSCAEMIFYIFCCSRKIKIDKKIALCLYSGLVTDTGMFQWSNTNKFSFYTAMKLLSYGINPYAVYKNLYRQRRYESIILLSKVLSTLEIIKLTENYKVGVISATKEMFKSTNTTVKDTEDFINFPMTVAGVNIGIFLKEQNGKVKVSFRSDSVNVERVARVWSGGGHKYAAGATVEGTLQQVKSIVIEKLKETILSKR